MMFDQVPSAILMIRPSNFGFNPETAGTNAFQKQGNKPQEVSLLAIAEFDEMVSRLRSKGVDVIVVEDTREPLKTDSIFPNNWISTHHDGRIVLYPMMAPSRRNERRTDILDLLRDRYQVSDVIDFSEHENENRFLEGTGSIVFDHANRIAYACRSGRTDGSLLEKLGHVLGYKTILFDAFDEDGVPIYHTNVMMWVGEKLAGVCLDSIRNDADQEILLGSLAQSGHKVVALSFQQMRSFAGNMFELKNAEGGKFLLMSVTAFQSLLPGQLAELSRYVEILPVAIPTIEEYGGGSVRCMVAGVHLT